MRIHRIAVPALLAAALAASPLAAAKADYIPCSPFPLSWPFCVADAVIDSVVGPFYGAPFYRVPVSTNYYPYNSAPNYPPPYNGPAFPAYGPRPAGY